MEHEKYGGRKLSRRQKVTLEEGEFNVTLKPIKIHEPGYVSISLQGLSKSGEEFGRIASLTLKVTTIVWFSFIILGITWQSGGRWYIFSLILRGSPANGFYTKVWCRFITM